MISTRAAPGLYLHVPFCSAICPYCDFAVRRNDSRGRARWLEALGHEVAFWLAFGGQDGSDLAQSVKAGFGRPFDTLYLGGGTPSALEGDQLGRTLELLAPLGRRGHVGPGEPDRPFIVLEANPEDVEPETLRIWRELGVGGVSLGVQAIDETSLRFLGRRHSPRQAIDAVESTLSAGFDWVSVDLIYCLPDRSIECWRSTLDAVAGLAPPHLSCYELTFHEATPFGRGLARGKLHTLDSNERCRRFLLTHERLGELGYEGYEVSNFARSRAARSRHNQKYWHRAPYLGLGPSAHSFGGGRRWWNRRSLESWSEQLAAGRGPVEAEESLDDAATVLEMSMLGLRTVEGVSLEELSAVSGVDVIEVCGALLERLSSQALAEVRGGILVPTLRGRAVAESMAVDLAALIRPVG